MNYNTRLTEVRRTCWGCGQQTNLTVRGTFADYRFAAAKLERFDLLHTPLCGPCFDNPTPEVLRSIAFHRTVSQLAE